MDNDRQVQSRADELLPEERAASSEDPSAQAKAILDDSNRRQDDRDAAPDTVLEHRTSQDTTPPPDWRPGGGQPADHPLGMMPAAGLGANVAAVAAGAA